MLAFQPEEVNMRKFLAVIGFTMLTLAAAQGVTWSSVTPSDLVLLFDDLRALEVTVPAGAESYSVSYGDSTSRRAYSGALRGNPAHLRIVTGFPAGFADCEDRSLRTAVLLIQFPTSGQEFSPRTPHAKQHICLPRPETPAGEYWLELEHPRTQQLDEWTPVYVYATYEDTTYPDGNHVSRLAPFETWYVVQVLFRSDATNTTGSPQPLEETLRTHPAAAQLFEEYDAQTVGQTD